MLAKFGSCLDISNPESLGPKLCGEAFLSLITPLSHGSWCYIGCQQKSRMLGWGCKVDPMCILCSIELETQSHLFVECSFSAQLWRLLQNCGARDLVHSWDEMLH
ncbi:hypothetical protein GQ457_06G026880 [Hibiscus cannabinus]